MDIREDIQQLKTTGRDLRKFGLTVGGVFILLGGLMLWRHKAHWPCFFWPGATLMFFGAMLPRVLKWIYVTWMSVALVLGFIMAHVILTLFFFLVVMPIGLVARVAGKDFLSLKLDSSAKSYWICRGQEAKTAADYERQF